MPINNNIQEIILTAGGGTENLAVSTPITLYIIKGTATLTSNWTIQPSGLPTIGTQFNFKYEAGINANGNTITVFGNTMPIELYTKTHEIRAYWNGTTWEVDFLADVSEEGIISESTVYTNQLYYLDAFINQYTTPPAGIDYLTMSNDLGTGSYDLTNSNLKTIHDAYRRTIHIVGSFNITGINETLIDEDTKYTIATSSYLVGNGNYEFVGHLNNDEIVTPIRIFTNDGNTGNIKIQFAEGSILTNISATYKIYINLKIPY